ncbi:anti-sigma factor [Zhihengliuella flava]|uniref:Anti-sigma K factor RskA C-terminal domain-containing protein n=1 Tax=Zhihengliuella flava TaxID=1285193 RepID=A0A931GMN6_9MICC|nr:anti-sigma factor [Zhihengliuella flava]MBG6085594.1 hypothetical protein [Zhihengliuella flava]
MTTHPGRHAGQDHDHDEDLGLDLVEEVSTSRRRRRPAPMKRLALVAIAVAVLVIGAVATVVTLMPRDVVAEVASADDAVSTSVDYEGGTAQVSVSSELNAGALEVAGLPAPQGGTAYRAWVVDASTGSHSPLEAIEPETTDGSVGFTGATDIISVDITLEPISEDSDVPTSEPILSVELPRG